MCKCTKMFVYLLRFEHALAINGEHPPSCGHCKSNRMKEWEWKVYKKLKEEWSLGGKGRGSEEKYKLEGKRWETAESQTGSEGKTQTGRERG